MIHIYASDNANPGVRSSGFAVNDLHRHAVPYIEYYRLAKVQCRKIIKLPSRIRCSIRLFKGYMPSAFHSLVHRRLLN